MQPNHTTQNSDTQTTDQQVQPQATQAQPVAVPPQPYMQSHVIWMAGITTITERKPAMLEWSQDNRVRMYELDSSRTQVISTVLDSAPQEILKFTANGSRVNLKTATGSYNIDFSNNSDNLHHGATAASAALGALGSGAGGLIGLAASSALQKRSKDNSQLSNLSWWRDNLSRYGVKSGGISAEALWRADIIGWVIAGTIGLIFIITLIVSSAL